MGTLLSGKDAALSYREKIKKFSQKRLDEGKSKPCLATIIVGNDGGSQYYVKNQQKLCSDLLIDMRCIELSAEVSLDEIRDVIFSLNEDKNVHGIILQMPLPKGLDSALITSFISCKKDIDGLTNINSGKFYKGEECFIPCTPRAVIEILKYYNIEIKGKNCVIIGRSNVVGKPASLLLLKEDATVTICHSKTKDIEQICRNADILVSAIGKPNFVSKEFVKEGTVVIDVGTTMVEGKIQGDVQKDVLEKAGFMTPVPGGVGSMTTTLLLKNLCEGIERYVY